MRLIPSLCSILWFPASRKNLDEFRRMAEHAREKGIRCIEYYHDGPDRGKIGQTLGDLGLDSVYVGVAPHKEQRLHLCDVDPSRREDALHLARRCLDEAADQGVPDAMFNAGQFIPGREPEALDALFRSFAALYEHIARRGYRLNLLIEPCDSQMDSRQLIGPTPRAKAFCQRLRDEGMPLSLVMDSAHVAEEGEDFLASVRSVLDICPHIHYANCLICDPSDPLYGDKHISYDHPGGVWSPAALAALSEQLFPLYEGRPLRLAMEALCREEDPYAHFDRAWSQLPFLHA